ncbi:MAG: hypothetical protein KIS66_06270 [Fimbriimonadaceae bacterium]|nr:hypothetical protein [Fimbriimonadaceae bacterium]
MLQVADYEDVCVSEEMDAFLAEDTEAESAARERLTADGLTPETRALMAGVGGYVRKAIVAASNINMTDPGFRNRLRDRVAAEVIRQNRIQSSGEQTVAALCAKLATNDHGR